MSFSRQISLVVPQLNRPNQTLQQHQQPLQWSSKNMEKSSFKHPTEAFRNPVSQKTRVQQHDQLTQQQEQLKDQQKDRLTVLHSRLQQEAEKIRKWKTLTEMELKQKDQKLQEAKLTIDKQQKQMLDIQLEKESLDSCIKDTATNQKEMHRKINSTRDMCHALKEHTLRIEQALELGEGDRTVLIERNQELMEQYQDLGRKFNQLEKIQGDTHATFDAQISKERSHIEQLSKELEIQRKDSETKLTTVEEQLSLCNAKLEKSLNDQQLKEQLIVSLTDEKSSIEKDLACKEDRISSLLLDLESSNTTVAQKNEELSCIGKQLLQVTNERNTHKEEIIRLEDVIAAMRKEHAEETQTVECEKQELNYLLKNTEQRLLSIQKDLISSEEDKSGLQNKCNELEAALQLSTDDKSELSTKLSTLQEEFDGVTADYNSIQKLLSVCQTQLEDEREQLVKKEAEKESVIVEWSIRLETEQEKALSKTNELLKIQNELEREKQELMDKLIVAENDKSCVQSQNDSLKDRLTNITTIMEAKVVMLTEKTSQAEKECTRLQLSVQDFTVAIEGKNSTIGNFTQKVNDLTKVIEEKDASLCNMKDNKCTTEEQLSTSNNQLLAMTSELDTVKEQYSSLMAENTALQSTIEQQSDNQSLSVSQLKEEIIKLQETLKTSKVQENKLKAMVDAQAREMGVTLERYKMENTRIVAMKDKELETFKDQEVKEKGRLMTNINDLQERIQLNSAQKKELMEKVADLQKQLTDKEDELTQLIAATSTLQLATPMVHKTPPHLVKLVQSKPITPSRPKRMMKPKRPTSEKRIPFSPLVSSTPYNQQHKPFSSSTLPTKLYDSKVAGDEEDLSDCHVKETVTKKTLNKVLMGVGTPKGRTGRKPGLKRKQSKKENKEPKGMNNLSWFDLDPVFGFPPED